MESFKRRYALQIAEWIKETAFPSQGGPNGGEVGELMNGSAVPENPDELRF